jgi:alpha-galactosidase
MQLIFDRIELADGRRALLGGSPGGEHALDRFIVGIASSIAASHVFGVAEQAHAWSWSIAAASSWAQTLRAVSIVLRVVDTRGPLRMFRHGYQSWSPCDVAVFGRDRDPSLADGSLELVRGVHQADQRVVTDRDELRSEWLTLLVDDSSVPVLIGFDGGDRHDGTFRLRNGAGGPELWCEAFLGDVELAAGQERHLHDLLIARGSPAEDLLAEWATHAGRVGAARVDAPYQVGWCSWYHYFHDVTEADLDHNLALADSWPFDVFQLDDGYQAAIGDWLITNDKFPSDIGAIADRIAAAGRTPGIWIAPFLAAPDSRVAIEHPGWLARFPDGSPLITMFNPPWGGGLGGFMYGLDTTHPEVIEHLEALARTLVDVGFDYLKLDFTFSPSYDGVWHDPSQTPAQRVRAGFDAIRRGAGDAFLLGCGSPQSNVVGVVDGNRIGPDVAPSWPIEAKTEPVAGYRGSQPSTRNAWFNTAARSFMHRRLWLNDPDCLMLRDAETELTAEQMRTWTLAVGVSGGMALVSDDLALVDAHGRALLDEAIELGRAADDAARTGDVPTSPGLLSVTNPASIASGSLGLDVDGENGTSALRSTAPTD